MQLPDMCCELQSFAAPAVPQICEGQVIYPQQKMLQIILQLQLYCVLQAPIIGSNDSSLE